MCVTLWVMGVGANGWVRKVKGGRARGKGGGLEGTDEAWGMRGKVGRGGRSVVW